jgi:GrpB-like predicted nucleotidyltransferase (UPF0157 family)
MGLRTVDITPYDPARPGAFAAERARITAISGPSVRVIEHIGSTAVPGLPAKPTIDIAAGFDDLADFYRRREQTRHFGYEYRPAAAFHDGHLFLRQSATASAPTCTSSACRSPSSTATWPSATTCAPPQKPPAATETSSSAWPPSTTTTAAPTRPPRPPSSRTS